MTSIQRIACSAALIGLCFAAPSGAYAQVGSINSVIVTPRVFNDIPAATLNSDIIYQPYPHPSLISFSEQNVSKPTGFANRDVWDFSNNGGASAYLFQNNDYFSVSMSLTLMGSADGSRKEAGFLFNTIGGDGQFIVNTDHEIVAFGGPLPFYAFPSTFNSGSTITLGMTYLNVGGVNSIIYSANGVNSPALPFTDLEQGIIDGTKLGGYFQIQNSITDPNNSGIAVFQNISITSVPEPSSFVLLAAGILPLLMRRRRI